ncbi:hypothetical protein [Dickeya dianthicola]|nr:hypothetical protein [Dickeya dianthicola]MCI4237360.1 hypothetical protein [Dickeya dianthicola]MCI4256020.1 hypothetical protein [Dickeya dianthicola]
MADNRLLQDMTPEKPTSAAGAVRLPLTAQPAVYAGNTAACFVTSG